MRAIARKYDPVAMAEALADANLPPVDEAQVRYEFKRFIEGVRTLSTLLSFSDDRDEIRLFLATMTEFRNALYDAETPADQRLYDLERWHRNNNLSWTATS